MKEKLVFFILIFWNIAFINVSRADSIHKKCLKAKDYVGCVNVFSKSNKIESVNSQNFFKDSPNLFKKNYEKICFSEIKQEINNSRDLLIKELSTEEVIKNICSCYVSNNKIKPFIKNNDVVPTSVAEKVFNSCSTKEIYTYMYGGDIFYNKKYFWTRYPNLNHQFYSIDAGSVKQQRIRGSYGRYIEFIGRTTNSYRGEIIPGKEGFIDCDWGGGGSAYINRDYGLGNWSSGGSCYGEEGRPEKIIPGGVDRRYYKYSLDCVDKTFDRKGDREGHTGSLKKGWMKIGNDPTAVLADGLYCSSISDLPKY